MSRTGDSNEVVATWEGDWKATVQAGPFTMIVDEPKHVGGTFSGPMPTEYLLASMASCYVLALAWSARKSGVDMADVEVSAVGEYDGPRFARIRLTVRSTMPREEIEPLLEQASSVCYVSNTLAQPPQIDIEITGD